MTMSDKRAADAMARQLLGVLKQIQAAHAGLEAIAAQVDAALEMVAGQQEQAAEREKHRAAADSLEGGEDEPTGVKVFGGRRFRAADIAEAPTVPPIPAHLRPEVAPEVAPDTPPATPGTTGASGS